MNAPPKISHASYWFAGTLIGMTTAGVMAVLFFFNPSQYHFYPVCQFHRLTGWNCPGCGMTRALYALLHGDIRTALRDNVLLVAVLVFLPFRGAWLAAQKLRGRPDAGWVPGSWLGPLLVIALVFTVLRNLPAFAFLSPA